MAMPRQENEEYKFMLRFPFTDRIGCPVMRRNMTDVADSLGKTAQQEDPYNKIS